MTKEAVAEIISYCEEQKVSYKTRLQELDIPLWKFYDAKRKYIANEDNSGEFLQLLPGSQFFQNPIKPERRGGRSKRNDVNSEPAEVSIELKTPKGTMMRISGRLTGRQIQEIIVATSANVQS